MILVIYAHPGTEGSNSLMLSELKRRMDLEVIDLYKMEYDPVLKREELYTSGNKKVSSVTKKLQKKISKADKLIFIYPSWWNGPPAILKGFFDKVLLPGFAFTYEGRLPKGLLKGKKAAVIVTHGAPNWYTKFVMMMRGEKVVTKDTLRFCGIKSKTFMIGNATKLNENKIMNVADAVKKYIIG